MVQVFSVTSEVTRNRDLYLRVANIEMMSSSDDGKCKYCVYFDYCRQALAAKLAHTYSGTGSQVC